MSLPRRITLVAILSLALHGCWKVERSELPRSTTAFSAPGAPEGWTVRQVDVDLECPDGRAARMIFVSPESTEPLPVAVLYHSGSFDFVRSPDPANPIGGVHLQDPPRLEAPWSIRMGFATLGMFPPPLSGEAHEGTLPVALAERDIAMVLPVNCWGDWWHNEPGARDNDFESDFFFRSGRAMAEWGYRVVTQPAFADAVQVEIPFEVDPERVYVLGLGEGGRAVGELLAIDDDEDGDPDFLPTALMVDSMIDDLSLLPAAQPSVAEGLTRIFADDFSTGALSTVRVLPPTAFVYSAADAVVPDGANDALLERLQGNSQHAVFEGVAALHVLSNADADIASDVADFLVAASP